MHPLNFRAGRLAMIRGVTAISPITVAIFAGPNRLPTEAVSEADASIQGKYCILFCGLRRNLNKF